MKLSDLLGYEKVVVQCHDNPDADALASGWGVFLYLENHGVNVRFIYGGKFPIQKSNLVLMEESFGIPVEHVTELEEVPDLLITVDCQYGSGNVQKFQAKKVAIIDHHRVSVDLPELSEVRSNICSCSTIVWDMLRQENFDISDDLDISTAFYYGLLTDSSNFAEVSHPLDRDLRDFINYRKSDIIRFRNSNLTLDELKIAGEAMEKCEYVKEHRYGFVEVRPCDPNLLGIVSDTMLEVNGMDTCLAYTVLQFGVKLSFRSCVKETKANELASFITDGIGSGGGHMDKAGGFIDKDCILKMGVEYTSEGVKSLLLTLMNTYFTTSEIIYAAYYHQDVSKLPIYTKNRLRLGYVDAGILPIESETTNIRTLEGDVDVTLDSSFFIMIGIDGEIYPIRASVFDQRYETSQEKYQFPGDYEPTVQDTETGKIISIVPFARTCYSTGTAEVYARELTHRVKVFTSWDQEKYYLGKPGDYLVSRIDNPNDVYVVERTIFHRTYSLKNK